MTPGLELVPVPVAYLCMGLGLLAGIAVAHLIWSFAHIVPERPARLVDRRGREIVSSTRSAGAPIPRRASEARRRLHPQDGGLAASTASPSLDASRALRVVGADRGAR